MKLNPSDTSIPKLPDSYVIQPPVELAQTDVFSPRFGLNGVRPLVEGSADGDVVTWAGYNSLLASDVSVKPPAVIGVYRLFPDKAASAEVLTSGRAESMLNEHYIKCTRYAQCPPGLACIAAHAQAERIHVEYCNNVMGPSKSYSMWNERSQTVP